MTRNMRWLRLVVPAAALAAWLATSFGQPEAPPPAPRPPADNAETEERPPATPPADDEKSEPEDEFDPETELQPDAAVTFPVDI